MKTPSSSIGNRSLDADSRHYWPHRRMESRSREQVLASASGPRPFDNRGLHFLTCEFTLTLFRTTFWSASKSCASLCKAKFYDYSNGPYQEVRAAHGCG